MKALGTEIAAASFRDPRGFVFRAGEGWRRCIRAGTLAEFEAVETTGLLDDWLAAGKLVAYRRAKPGGKVPAEVAEGDLIIDLAPLACVTHPYEWPFQALKDAALFQLDLLAEALARGVTATDATAYNVQFDGTRPLFIDHLSWRPYRDDELWAGHGQFCEQFLHPLLLQAYGGIAYNAWYRGRLEGIAAEDVARALPLGRSLHPKVLMQLLLPLWFERRAARAAHRPETPPGRRPRLPKAGFAGLLGSLRAWIEGLEIDAAGHWRDYARTHSYSEDAVREKAAFVAGAVNARRPAMLWDFGCNTGFYAGVALDAGAARVVGFESDPASADQAFRQAKEHGRKFLPLVQDIANPSPAQGWRQAERMGLAERDAPDFVLALALIHHLRFRNNVPMREIAAWLTGTAPAGIVEYVPKSDPMCRKLIGSREELFDDYELEHLIGCIERGGRVTGRQQLSGGRELISFERGA